MYRRKLYGLDTQLVGQSFHLRTDGLALGAVDQRCHKVVRQRVEAEVLRCRPFSIGQGVHGLNIFIASRQRPSKISPVVDPSVGYWHGLKINPLADIDGLPSVAKLSGNRHAPVFNLRWAKPVAVEASGQRCVWFWFAK